MNGFRERGFQGKSVLALAMLVSVQALASARGTNRSRICRRHGERRRQSPDLQRHSLRDTARRPIALESPTTCRAVDRCPQSHRIRAPLHASPPLRRHDFPGQWSQ